MKIVTIVGARPQFIKAAPVSAELRERDHDEVLVHTGQHYDYQMSQVFFDELGITSPDVYLEVGSGTHAWQTGQIMIRVEEILVREKPDWVLVYGDTNSTLAGALAASKLNLLLAHVEAGLRSFNRTMPEEHNRVLTDHCSDMLFCPTRTAVENLAREGIHENVILAGDTMYDAVLCFADTARERATVLRSLGLVRGDYLLLTLHRAYNTDYTANLRLVLTALGNLDETIIFPVHPRTRKRLAASGGMPAVSSNVLMIEPVSYLNMLVLEENAKAILTDSGGVQKEAYFFGVPCITLRTETEWTETVEAGRNLITGADPQRIEQAVRKTDWPRGAPPQVFGSGKAAEQIVSVLERGTTPHVTIAGELLTSHC